jgi:hypothetical protein
MLPFGIAGKAFAFTTGGALEEELAEGNPEITPSFKLREPMNDEGVRNETRVVDKFMHFPPPHLSWGRHALW